MVVLATTIASTVGLASTSPDLGCMLALWAFGALCAAAGIGGGGMIVSILMIIGNLTPGDAVPLSKAVVFLGALVSLALNIGRSRGGLSKPLVDCLLLQMIVPMALLGTLLGVMTNERTPGWGVVVVLASMMIPTFFLVLRRAQQQYVEEVNAEKTAKDCKEVDEVQALLDGVRATDPPGCAAKTFDMSKEATFDISTPPDSPRANASVRKDDESSSAPAWEGKVGSQKIKWPPPLHAKQASHSTLNDVLLLGLLLAIVISGGVVQHHVKKCYEHHEQINNRSAIMSRAAFQSILPMAPGALSCRHPVLRVAFWGRAEKWLAEKGFVSTTLVVLLVMPIWACFSTAFYYANQAVRQGWSRHTVACYLFIGLVAGSLAGFVGIGGGLIFSPFFLLMGIDPSVAVATSSTCVVFTSSSTAIQYFLMDRIPTQLALTYGAVNAFASLCGTLFVQHVGERWAMKKSYITFIVAISLAVSIAISSVKCTQLIRMALRGLPT